jgi:polyphenol oxidase
MLQPLLAPELQALDGVRHAFFTREGGVSEGPLYGSLNGGLGSADAPERVAENRHRMAAYLGAAPDWLASLHQVHSAEALVLDRPFEPGPRPKADGFATRTPGLALAIATADCGPLLFADAEAGVIGAAHAGWKGTLAGVIEATVAAMEELGARRSAITAVLGPTIGPDAYEVGPELRERFVAEQPDAARHFRPGRGDRLQFDLPGAILQRLQAAGLGRIGRVPHCTYADERRFFSYRRTTHRGEPDYGRLISAVVLAG